MVCVNHTQNSWFGWDNHLVLLQVSESLSSLSCVILRSSLYRRGFPRPFKNIFFLFVYDSNVLRISNSFTFSSKDTSSSLNMKKKKKKSLFSESLSLSSHYEDDNQWRRFCPIHLYQDPTLDPLDLRSKLKDRDQNISREISYDNKKRRW